MTLIRVESFSKLLTFSLLIGLFTFTGCSDDVDNDVSKASGCDAYPTLEGDISIDGEDVFLVSTELKESTTFGATTYVFNIGGMNSGCEELETITIIVNVPNGDTVDGNYEFDAVLSARATGTSSILNVVTATAQDTELFKTGSVMITENVENNFTFDISAVTSGGVERNVSATVQF